MLSIASIGPLYQWSSRSPWRCDCCRRADGIGDGLDILEAQLKATLPSLLLQRREKMRPRTDGKYQLTGY
jgi:hypothetical protein